MTILTSQQYFWLSNSITILPSNGPFPAAPLTGVNCQHLNLVMRAPLVVQPSGQRHHPRVGVHAEVAECAASQTVLERRVRPPVAVTGRHPLHHRTWGGGGPAYRPLLVDRLLRSFWYMESVYKYHR